MKIAKTTLVQKGIYSKFEILLQSQRNYWWKRTGRVWIVSSRDFCCLLTIKKNKSELLRDVQNILILFKICDTLGTGFLRNLFPDPDYPGFKDHYHQLLVMTTFPEHLSVLYKILKNGHSTKWCYPRADGCIYAVKMSEQYKNRFCSEHTIYSRKKNELVIFTHFLSKFLLFCKKSIKKYWFNIAL